MVEKLFEKGVDFLEFFKNIEETTKEKIDKILGSFEDDQALKQKIASIDEKLHILVFAEDWCPDCVINMPALYFAEKENENISLSIVRRDGNESHMEKYKVNGKPRVPTFLVLDVNYEEIGHMIERPKKVREKLTRGNEQEVLVAKRKYKKGCYAKCIIEDLLSVVNAERLLLDA